MNVFILREEEKQFLNHFTLLKPILSIGRTLGKSLSSLLKLNY